MTPAPLRTRKVTDLDMVDIGWLRVARALERLYPHAKPAPGRVSATEIIRRWERATGKRA